MVWMSLAFVLVGCKDKDDAREEGEKSPSAHGLDGTWNLVSVNGTPKVVDKRGRLWIASATLRGDSGGNGVAVLVAFWATTNAYITEAVEIHAKGEIA